MSILKSVNCASAGILLTVLLSLPGCGGGGGGSGGSNVTAIAWAQPVYSRTDPSPYGGVVVGPPDDQTGGWSLSSNTWMAAGSAADIVFDNYGKIGAVGIARSQAGFNTNTEPALTYGQNLFITGPGDVFVVVLRNGRHAKLRIDSLTPGVAWYTYSNISFSYLLEQGTGATATPACTAPPSAPTGFSASQTAYGTVTFTWQPSAGATSYTLYSQGTPGVSKSSSAQSITSWQTNAGQPAYTLTNVALGTYYGAMTATNLCGESALSTEGGPTNVVTVAPSAPTVNTPTAGNARATLSWIAQAGATSYNTYWSTTPGVTKLNGLLAANFSSGQSMTGLTNGTTYYIVVTAVNSAGESADSAEVSVTPYDPMVPRLDSLTKITGLGATVRVCLTDLSGGMASGWNIYRATTPGVTATPANLVSNNGGIWMFGGNGINCYDTTGLAVGTTYYYRATSVSGGGESTLSNELTITF